MPELDRAAVGDRVRALIAAHGRGVQSQLADHLGIRQPSVSEWVHHGRTPKDIYWAGIEEFFDELKPGDLMAAALGADRNDSLTAAPAQFVELDLLLRASRSIRDEVASDSPFEGDRDKIQSAVDLVARLLEAMANSLEMSWRTVVDLAASVGPEVDAWRPQGFDEAFEASREIVELNLRLIRIALENLLGLTELCDEVGVSNESWVEPFTKLTEKQNEISQVLSGDRRA